jgi:DUF4097 and DUF4098 domain-containing protein YvlB
MRRFLFPVAAILVAVPMFAHDGHGRSVSFDGDDPASTDCSALTVRFDGNRVPVLSEEVAIGNAGSLRVRAERNGGIHVVGTTRYAVTACKAAAAGVDPAQIRVNFNGTEVSGSGPGNEDWVLYFIVQTPRNASLELESTNGPVSVYRFDGTLNASAANGPLSLKESTGTIVATAKNGPISLAGGSGNVKLSATNGPVSVKLDGSAWDGNLEASTQNGPVSLKLPRGYRSGVVLESNGHGPVSCRAEDCYSARQRAVDTDDFQPRKIELGSGPQNVRLSTVNGPISVKDRE